jgi:alpha-galactosidase
MKLISVAVYLFSFCLATSRAAEAQSPSVLQTPETTLRLETGRDNPKLIDLKTQEGTVWKNRGAEPLPDSVESEGKKIAVRWEWNRAASHSDAQEISFVYDSASPKLRLTWEWQARTDHGPIEHQIRIENLDDHEVWLPFIDSIRLDWECDSRASLEHLYIDKGAGSPSAVGTHVVPLQSGYRWEGTSSTYAHPETGEAREIIPWFLVERKDGTQSGWYVGIEFSARTRLALERAGRSLRSAAGLNPNPGPFKTRLKSGDSFETPMVFLGGTEGGIDATGIALRRWVRDVLTNPADWKNPHYPTLVNNSWGSGEAINEDLAMHMLRDSAELGFEMFHIDAGWFRGVGDWYPDPKKFPHGLAPIADEAHRLGLKFGLWCAWTQAALDTEPGALNLRDPRVNDWVVADTAAGWEPEPHQGQTIDLGVPEAAAWAQRELDRIVNDYHLDMLEHDGYLVTQGCDRSDHPHAPPDPTNTQILKAVSALLVESSNSTDVSYHSTQAYYSIYSTLRKNHPGLMLEICNDGGRMVDFGSAAHGDYFSITDTYDPISNRRAFFDASHVLPPAMLEAYVEKWPVPRIENFRYMLRSGMMGWLTIMLDTTTWTAEQHNVAKAEFELYRSTLRPFIRDAELYHISSRPDGAHWDSMEYFDPMRNEGVVFAFRGSIENQDRHTFLLEGVRRGTEYQLHFQDQSSPDKKVTGRELLEQGLSVALPVPNSSELVFVKEIAP